MRLPSTILAACTLALLPSAPAMSTLWMTL